MGSSHRMEVGISVTVSFDIGKRYAKNAIVPLKVQTADKKFSCQILQIEVVVRNAPRSAEDKLLNYIQGDETELYIELLS